MNEPEHSLPDFDLVDPIMFRPEALIPKSGDSPIARLNLALALVFNDLKDFLWLNSQLIRAEEEIPKGVRSAARGQLNGMRSHVVRRWIALLHELLDPLKGHEEVLQTPEFLRQVGLMPRPYKRKWHALVGLALSNPREKTEDGTFRRQLDRLRNKVVNHYGDTRALQSGYRHFFFDSRQGVFGEKACVSSGRSAEQTRFYFADAAANGALYGMTDTSGSVFSNQVGLVIADLNAVLKTLVDAYLADKPADETA